MTALAIWNSFTDDRRIGFITTWNLHPSLRVYLSSAAEWTTASTLDWLDERPTMVDLLWPSNWAFMMYMDGDKLKSGRAVKCADLLVRIHKYSRTHPEVFPINPQSSIALPEWD